MKRIPEITASDLRLHSSIAAIGPDGYGDIVWETRLLAPLCSPENEGKPVANQLCVSIPDFSESGLQQLYAKLLEIDPSLALHWCGTPRQN
ncbi:hypothetical protein DFR40_0801 [Azonexus fungiphilus]|uniref:Uncharacterized protein n=1 Tax=Azonexus fungiphilus TaxID=146940 RepID=A0A495WH22_9RHOO|nr:hypothetical protein [Azonexus fungiphilus]RKT60659.1 hypothetical protein DFR40_0801 [Azonexus fungiphilus]